MGTKHRKYTRFLTPNNTFAALGFRFSKVGKVKDISVGGLAFEYLDDSDVSNRGPSQVNVFLSENEFHLSNVPCNVVYDVEAAPPHENHMTGTPFKTKRCGVRFGILTEGQLAELEFFLENETTGIAV